jgi:multidrug resistance protein
MKRSPLIIVLLTVFIALIGFGIVIPIIPVYAEKYGASGFEIGLLIMVYSLMQFLIAPLAGKLSDKIGRRPVLIGALFLTSISYIMFGLSTNLTMLFISRMLAGIGGADITVAQACIADFTEPKDRARGMGLFGAAFGAGFVLGPAIAAFTAPVATWLPSFIAAGLAGGTAIFAVFALPEPKRHVIENKKRVPNSEIFTKPLNIIILLHFVAVFFQFMMPSLIVLYTLKRYGWHETENGFLLAMIGIVSMTIQGGFMSRLTNRFGENNLILYGTLIAGIGLVMVGSSNSIPFLVLSCFVNMLGFAVVLPSLSSIASQKSPPGQQGFVLGRFQSAGSMGRILAPVVGGFVFDAISPESPFLVGGYIGLVTAVIVFFVFRSSSWSGSVTSLKA